MTNPNARNRHVVVRTIERAPGDTVDALASYRSAHGLLSHDEAITTLLERASEDVS